MKTFVAGASGYIGSVVVEKLLEAEHEVIGVARSSQKAVKIRNMGALPWEHDILDRHALSTALADVDAVIAVMALSEKHIQVFTEALHGRNIPFIATTGTGVYGDTGDLVPDESFTPPVIETAMTGMIKAMESGILDMGKQGIQSMIVRPSLVYGRGGSGTNPTLERIHQAAKDGYALFVDGYENWIASVHVDDLAGLYLLTLQHGQAGDIFNAATEQFVTGYDLAVAISHAGGQNGTVKGIDADAAKELLGFESLFYMVNMRVSSKKAKSKLGWQPSRAGMIKELKSEAYRVRTKT